MKSSLEFTDQESAAVAVSPSTRVSLADIEASIAAEFYLDGATFNRCISTTGGPLGHTVMDVPLADILKHTACLTMCLITMRNGFTVIGKAAPADPTNFNPELGRKFAREDAIRQIWPLMGYALREKLMEKA